MKHAEKLMGSVLFLDGEPEVQTMPKIVAGQDVQDQFRMDLEAKMAAIVSYNEGIANCSEAGEDGSVGLVKANLQERHTNYLETQLTFIQQVGLANYPAQTMGE